MAAHNEQATAQDISTVLLNSLHGKDANRYPATVAHLCHPTDPTAPQGENSKAVLYLDSLCGGNLISEHLLRSFEDETGAHHSRHRSYTTYGPPSQENALVPAYTMLAGGVRATATPTKTNHNGEQNALNV